MDAEMDILKIKAHEKILGSSGKAPLRNANSSTKQDGSLNELSAKTKCKRRQRHMYNNRHLGKKAQQKAQNQLKANATIDPAPVFKTDQ